MPQPLFVPVADPDFRLTFAPPTLLETGRLSSRIIWRIVQCQCPKQPCHAASPIVGRFRLSTQALNLQLCRAWSSLYGQWWSHASAVISDVWSSGGRGTGWAFVGASGA